MRSSTVRVSTPSTGAASGQRMTTAAASYDQNLDCVPRPVSRLRAMKGQRPVGNGFGNERAVTGCFRGQQMDSVDALPCPNETARHSVEKPERFHTAEVTGSKPVAPTKEDL